MKMIPTIVSASSRSSFAVFPTSDFHLGIDHHRRSDHAYSTHPEVTP
jgi:hypothetical protein